MALFRGPVVRRHSRPNTTKRLTDVPMRLARLWREHLAAGCPTEVAGVEIAGSDARVLDAEITACASALICRKMTVDGRMERRLTEIRTALAEKLAHCDQADTG